MTPRPILQCRDLRKSFGDLVAVNGVSFSIAAGETYGLLGPNGAGKTTTISMVCGLLEHDAGEVLVDGRPLTTRSVDAKAAIGYVPQELAVYPDLTEERERPPSCPPPARSSRSPPPPGRSPSSLSGSWCRHEGARDRGDEPAAARSRARERLLPLHLPHLAHGLRRATRRLGVSRRMVSTPTPARTVLLGDALGRFAVALEAFAEILSARVDDLPARPLRPLETGAAYLLATEALAAPSLHLRRSRSASARDRRALPGRSVT